MDLDKIVGVYVKMRDALSEKRKAFEEEETKIKGQMRTLEAALLAHLNNVGGESVRTANGTFYRQEEIRPTCNDWDALYAWIAENNEFEALERRVKKTFVQDYMDTHKTVHEDGSVEYAYPPGVSVMREYVVRIRRAQ